MPTKLQQKKRLGVAISNQKQVARIKKSKADRLHRSIRKVEADAAGPGDVLLRSAEDAEEMDADTFLDGGFEQYMGDDSAEEEETEVAPPPPAAKAARGSKAGSKGAGSSSQKSSHKSQLEALEKSDPAFFKYLQQTDKSLLNFEDEEEEEEDSEAEEEEEDADSEELEEDDGEEEEDEDEDEDEEDEDEGGEEEDDEEEEEGAEAAAQPRKPQPRTAAVELTVPRVEGWVEAVSGGKTHRASLKQLVAAFRAAVRFGDDESEGSSDMVFSSSHAFNAVMRFSIGQMDAVLRAHLEGGAAPAGRKGRSKATREGKKAGKAVRVDALPHWHVSPPPGWPSREPEPSRSLLGALL